MTAPPQFSGTPVAPTLMAWDNTQHARGPLPEPDPNKPTINFPAERELIEADNGRFDDNSDNLSFKQLDGFEGIGKEKN